MTPARLLLAALLLLPVLEISLLVWVGGRLGALPTAALVVLAAVAGVMLLRLQGLATLARVQASLARRELPAGALLEGLVLLGCGALLITPGFLTDLLALLGLIPPLRRALVGFVLRHGLAGATVQGGPQPPAGSSPRTLEGEYWRDDDR